VFFHRVGLDQVEFSREGRCSVHLGWRFLPTSTLKSNAACLLLASVTPLQNGDKIPPVPNRINMTMGHRETRLDFFFCVCSHFICEISGHSWPNTKCDRIVSPMRI
jgi:hypothetical protein